MGIKPSPQLEIDVLMSPTQIKAAILLNRLRLIGVLDLLQELKKFVIDKLPEESEEEEEEEEMEEMEEEKNDG